MHNFGSLFGGEHGMDLLKHALAIHKSVYGEDHPHVARTLFALGDLYHDLGNLQKAKMMIQDALSVFLNINNSPCK